MRIALALLAFALGAIYVALGLPAVWRGDAERARGSVTWLARGGLPPGDHLQIDDGVLVAGGDLAAHRVGQHVYLPLLAPDVAASATAAGRFDARAALAAADADRLFVVRVPIDDLRAAVARDAAQALPVGALAQFSVEGRLHGVGAWPAAAQDLLLQRLAIPPAQLLCIDHGDRPLGRVAGSVMLVLAALLLWFGARLWRGRARGTSGGESGRGGWPKVVVSAAGLLTGVGVLAARFGDDLARHGDAASLRASRKVDDLPSPGALGKVSLSDDDVLQRLLEGIDLGLDLQQASEFHAFVVEAMGLDHSILVTSVLRDLEEHYRRDAQGRYVLTSMRTTRRITLARDGEPGEVREVVATTPPDPALGARVWLQILPPDGDQPARLDIDAIWRPGDGYAARVELELVAGDWQAFARGDPVTLRIAPRGLDRLAEVTKGEWHETAKQLVASQFPGQAMARVDVEVAVLRVPGARIRVEGEQLEWRSDGPGAVQMGIRLRQ